jgi:hypothetical protein
VYAFGITRNPLLSCTGCIARPIPVARAPNTPEKSIISVDSGGGSTVSRILRLFTLHLSHSESLFDTLDFGSLSSLLSCAQGQIIEPSLVYDVACARVDSTGRITLAGQTDG